MKNRKKIFIFVLLLCTIFSTLILVRPKVKAQITDLSGTTWILNDPLYWDWSTVNINFTSNGQNFTSISSADTYINSLYYVNRDGQVLAYYVNADALPDGEFYWTNQSYRTISILSGTDATNVSFISYLASVATQVGGSSGYDVTLEQGSNSLDFSLFAVGEVLYQINETGYNVPIYTNATPLPYTIEEVESIQFINNSTDYRLLVYQDASTYYSIEPGNSSLLYSITADRTYDLELVRVSTTPTTYTISGGYQFYPTISSSIFGDTSEQELDILLEGNFWLYGNESVQWDMFTLHTLSSEDTALYFCYESSIFNKYNYVGQLINNNTQIQTYVGERTIYFEEQEVSEDVYNWLNDNGRFGNYDDTLPTPAPDNPFGFVVDMVNDFLQIEFLPGFKFIHLLYIAISIPLLMYILKLFLGG